MNIILIAGVSGSGKTTWRNVFLKDNPDYVTINADSIRAELSPINDEGDQTNNGLIFSKIIPQRLEKLITENKSAIIDNVNADRRSRKLFIDFAKKYNIDILCYYFLPNVEQSVSRIEGRGRKVPRWVIEKQAKNWVTPTIEEGFSQVNDLTGWENHGESSDGN